MNPLSPGLTTAPMLPSSIFGTGHLSVLSRPVIRNRPNAARPRRVPLRWAGSSGADAGRCALGGAGWWGAEGGRGGREGARAETTADTAFAGRMLLDADGRETL